jgi:hypothetical protein
MYKKSVRPKEAIMSYLKYVFVIIIFSLTHAVAAQSLIQTIKEKGRDYVLDNFVEIAKIINDDEKITLAQILVNDLKGSDSIKVLLPLVKKDNIPAISFLAQKYNLGINGIPLNKNQAQTLALKLEEIYKSSRSDKDSVIGSLCTIFRNKNGALFNPEKELRYCKALYESGKVDATYAFYMLVPDSIFFDPSKGLALYKKCIDQNNIFCKWNYGWQGRISSHIARENTATDLFNFASSEGERKNSIATNNLGIFYEEGFGTVQNIQTAIELYEKGMNAGVQYSFYNLLRISFFMPGVWKDGLKNADQASFFLAMYDYFSPENDRADSVPFKQWLFEKNRLPLDSDEFKNYLFEKASRGDTSAACMMASELIRVGNYERATEFIKIGKRSSDINIKDWCSRGERIIQARQALKK